MSTATFFAGIALSFAVATTHAVVNRDGIRTLTLGTGTATAVAIAGAAIADRSTARRRS